MVATLDMPYQHISLSDLNQKLGCQGQEQKLMLWSVTALTRLQLLTV